MTSVETPVVENSSTHHPMAITQSYSLGSMHDFTSYTTPPDARPQVELRWSMLALTSVIVLSAGVNLSVFITVSCTKRLQVPFYHLVASLAITDLLCAATVIPAGVIRAFLNGAVPEWVCLAWQWGYLGYTCIRLTHCTVATLHCHLSLQNPLCCRPVLTPCYVIAAIIAAWLVPVLLTLPYVVLQLFTPGASTDFYKCPRLDVNYFYAGVVPTFLVPCLVMVIAYARVVFTINGQAYMAQQLQSEANSDVSSNGFVTYENSEESNPCSTVQVEQKPINTALPIATRNGILHYENGSISHMGNTTSCMNNDISNEEDDQVSFNSTIIHEQRLRGDAENEEGNSDDNSSMIIHPDTEIDGKQSHDVKDQQEKQCPFTGVLTEDDCQVSEADGNVSVVHVKGKCGKEALNEPIDDGDVALEWELVSKYMNGSYRPPLAQDNPSFEMDNASEDLPFSASIKIKKFTEDGRPLVEKNNLQETVQEGKGTSEADAESEASMHCSPASSNDSLSACKSEHNGVHKSILIRDRNKRQSGKSVKFDLPERQNSTWQRSRLLSCKYKTKKGGGRSISAKNARINGINNKSSQTGSLYELSTPQMLKLAENSLARSAQFRYLSQAQCSHSRRLTKRIKNNKFYARLLYYIFLLIVAFNLPYTISTSLMVFRSALAETIPFRVYMLFEWMAYVPALITPLLYLFASADFRKSFLSVCTGPGTEIP